MRNAPRLNGLVFALLATVATTTFTTHAAALSESRMEPAAEDGTVGEGLPQEAFEGTTEPEVPTEDGASQGVPPAADDTQQKNAGNGGSEAAPAEIIRDLSTLPEPVKEMRERIVEAAASGDIERLRPLLTGTLKPPQIMNGESDDPIETLKNFSGDPDGQEILAIMLDILASGAARIDAGTPDETYVWPYFTGKPLASLTPPERVDLLRIVTAGDLMGMEENGNYNFYRIGIAPDGQWKFMAGGD